MSHLQEGLRLGVKALRKACPEAAGTPGSFGLPGLHGRQTLHQLRVICLP